MLDEVVMVLPFGILAKLIQGGVSIKALLSARKKTDFRETFGGTLKRMSVADQLLAKIRTPESIVRIIFSDGIGSVKPIV
jgi:hypothetical protein